MERSTIVDGVFGAVGHTPLLRLKRLSAHLGRDVLAKAEHLNPGGSIKDRAALGIIEAAERDGSLAPGGTIIEGTAGNTGIGLSVLALARGYKTLIVMPDNQAAEKYEYLRLLGAEVKTVPPVPFANPAHFYHTAKRLADEQKGAFFSNQFENTANADIHYEKTGPEIWQQTGGTIDALVLASGTGGTIGGTSRYLKQQRPSVRVVLADPYGSGLYEHIKHGVIKSEGSSVTEGIGIMRITANFAQAQIDDAVRVSDAKMVAMAHWLLHEEGLLVGSSAALNIFAAAKVAAGMSERAQVVTFICDSGQRYQSRLFNDAWLKEKNLLPKPGTTLDEILAD